MKKFRIGLKCLTICLVCCLMFNNIGFVAFAGSEKETVKQDADGGITYTTQDVEIESKNVATDKVIGDPNIAYKLWTYRTAIHMEDETETFC